MIEQNKLVLAAIQGILGNGAGIRWELGSRSAEIRGVTYEGRQCVVKFPALPILLCMESADRERQAEFLNRATVAFRDRLHVLEVPLSTPYQVATFQGLPVHVMSDEGEDCGKLVMREPQLLTTVLAQVVACMNGLLLNGKREVGIDARLSNFARQADGGVVYIDNFPPLLKFEGSYLVHFPNPTNLAEIEQEVERKFTPFGILRRLRFELMALHPDWDKPFHEVIAATLDRTIVDEVCSRFRDLPDQRLATMRSDERLAMLLELPAADVDTRREIMAKLIPDDENRPLRIAEVFAATSFVGATLQQRSQRRIDFERIVSELV